MNSEDLKYVTVLGTFSGLHVCGALVWDRRHVPWFVVHTRSSFSPIDATEVVATYVTTNVEALGLN